MRPIWKEIADGLVESFFPPAAGKEKAEKIVFVDMI